VEAQTVVILFSDKSTPPPLFRSVALAFEGQANFGVITSSDSQMMQRFQIDKAPAILMMFPDASKAEEGGQMQLTGARFDPRQHGPFRYGYIANFVGSIVAQRLQQLGKASDKTEGDGLPKKESKKELGPLPELSADSWEAECAKKGGLCAIAMLDGAESNTNKQAHIDMLTAMRKKRAGGPLAFSWIDATCHTSFAAAFNIYETDLPTMIVLSPSKLKWARAVGAFDETTLGAFGTGVATGRIRTDPISELPTLEAINCAEMMRGAEELEPETPLDDDFMAEILEEERKKKEALEAELAASMPAAEKKADKKKASTEGMSKLQKLEADLEECGNMDLLCTARREKHLKAIEKERELQEKLAKIAAKKKKAKKKAKKAAA